MSRFIAMSLGSGWRKTSRVARLGGEGLVGFPLDGLDPPSLACLEEFLTSVTFKLLAF